METSGGLTSAWAALASAFGCGLLMGIERERRKGTGPHRALAGVRSFTLAALAGAATAILAVPALLAVGALFMAILGATAYAKDRSGDPGVTTEIALFLAYVIGAMCTQDQLLAGALAVAATGLLAARERLHNFANTWLQPGEVRGGLILAALILIVAPLMPDRPLWGEVLNPQLLVRLLVVLLLIQSLAHLGRRLLQARQALALSALASGFVSSTATIANLGLELRAGRGTLRAQAGGAVLSCVATMLQMLAVAVTIQPAWLAQLAAPALASALVAGVYGSWLAHTGLADASEKPAAQMPADTPMFRLRDALLIAALLTAVQAGVYGLGLWLGDAGMMTGALLAALADIHSVIAALLAHGAPGTPAAPMVARTLMAAMLVHALSKSGVALASGGPRYALVVAAGVLGHTLVFVLGLWLLG